MPRLRCPKTSWNRPAAAMTRGGVARLYCPKTSWSRPAAAMTWRGWPRAAGCTRSHNSVRKKCETDPKEPGCKRVACPHTTTVLLRSAALLPRCSRVLRSGQRSVAEGKRRTNAKWIPQSYTDMTSSKIAFFVRCTSLFGPKYSVQKRRTAYRNRNAKSALAESTHRKRRK